MVTRRCIAARTLMVLVFFIATAGIAQTADEAQDYPARPVTLTVPAAAGGGTDTIGRLLTEGLGRRLAQPFVVDNRPGANGIIGHNAVAKAAPDGYHLLLSYASAMTISPSLYRQLPYHPTDAFIPIAQVGRFGNLLLVNPELPVHTVKDLMAYVQVRPDQLSFCSAGVGSGQHLTMAYLLAQSGTSMLHVPHKSVAACLQDVIAGRIQAAFGDISSTIELVRGGRVRALAHSGLERLPLYPDLPSLTEAGYPFELYAWFGFFAPANTPRAIVTKLNHTTNQLLQDPDMMKRLAALILLIFRLPHRTNLRLRRARTRFNGSGSFGICVSLCSNVMGLKTAGFVSSEPTGSGAKGSAA